VILHLTRELGVNLAGVEIILNTREKMAEMQTQIEEFVTTLNRELVARRRTPSPEEQHSLIRVVSYTSAAPAATSRKSRTQAS
jgi:MerR family transcriptional regulator/heat shock protein HspR